MADDTVSGAEDRGEGLLVPEARAIAGFTLAVAGLLGQNVITLGVQFLTLGPGGVGGGWEYALVLGFGTALPALLALALVLGSARNAAGWSAALARATVVVALVVLLGALMTVAGGLLHQNY